MDAQIQPADCIKGARVRDTGGGVLMIRSAVDIKSSELANLIISEPRLLGGRQIWRRTAKRVSGIPGAA